ncbi:KinB-signaling pathway activation protein [Thermoflavimicrobium daqui]|uniref:KinB signaling pathway activation protein n=1 Tax=Thermoflavimicrobium daqui TaxID=2137476 RepID=A0A364K389_9BACL|nr:KinB-signaling pathway activation protein [Thermoflavimicrobium daqui]RAL23297.1 hypothetical protein DL897_13115 [Thermoflavimicrobium daqui]
MTLKKLVWWFFSTLLLGGILGIVLGGTISLITDIHLGNVTKLLLTGTMFASVAVLGFFSYLIFNWLGAGFVRNALLFQVIQVLLILLVLGSLTYLFVSKFVGKDLYLHLLVPLLIAVIAWIVARVKVKWTQPTAFIPALFFMIAATTLEAIPSIKPKGGEVPLAHLFYTVLTLLSCNAWQILNLHRWIKKRPSIQTVPAETKKNEEQEKGKVENKTEQTDKVINSPKKKGKKKKKKKK